LTLLSRRSWPQAGPPRTVRAVHLGLGAFHRSHQAWYTEHAADAEPWGIAAFTGRSPGTADQLRAQDGLYTLVERGPERDDIEVVTSISVAHDGDDAEAWAECFASPQVALVTLTVTEAGYHLDGAGHLDLRAPEIAADVERLRGGGAVTDTGRGAPPDPEAGRRARSDPEAGRRALAFSASPVRTMPGRLVAGLAARRRVEGGPITIVPCDNLMGNGDVTRAVVVEMCQAVDHALADWISASVSFVSTVVDRITPTPTADDRVSAERATGHEDRCAVVAEPFSEWVLSGDFPAGRPAWESAGARLVGDVGPFALRKLCLLNGGHSLLAYAGSALGHGTVASAISDPRCRAWLTGWWDDITPLLGLPGEEVESYRTALLERWSNRRIGHTLTLIARDGSQKLVQRVVPVVHRCRDAGEPAPPGAGRILGAWLAHLRGSGAEVSDPRAAELVPLAQGALRPAARAVLDALEPGLGSDAALVRQVAAACKEIEAIAS
jgi:fructuronate reductase